MLPYYSTATNPALVVGDPILSNLDDGTDKEPFLVHDGLLFLGLSSMTSTNQIPRKLLKQIASVDMFAKQDRDGPFDEWATNLPIIPLKENPQNNGC